LHAALNAAEPVAAQLELLAASVASFTPERTEAVTGVPGADLAQVGRALAAAARPLVVCTRAATLCPRAADLLACLATLGAATRAGTTSWSSLLWLGRYSNSQGARDMGAVPYLLTGFQAVSDPEVRARFGRAWGISLPQAPGLAAWDMLGEVKGLFVMGDDPVSMLPDPARIRSALEELDFLAVQDIFLTATAELADVVLPGASFAEKDGTFTSAERRVQRVRQAVDPPGGARPDWEILSEISRRLGRRMGYRSPAEIMDRIASLTPAYSGISHSSLEGEWGVRWPLEAALGEAAPRLGNGAGGEPESHEDVAPEAQEGYPLVLYPDYALEAWADDALVAGCPGLARELGATRPARPAILEISPADAQERELRDGQRVRVRSRSGEMEATVQTNAGLRKGVLAIPFRRREAAARVMPASTHPETGVPGLVPCAVTIEKA
jgi:formate dehydrogenase major subunit/formate dehydrogenase alpha subunit